MGRVALRGIRAHLVRFLLSVLAVTLGVAFVAGTFSLRTMMSSTFDGIVDSSMPADAYVRGAQAAAGYSTTGTTGQTRNTIPASLADTIARVDGIAHAFADISGPIVLVGADGTAVQSTQSPSFAMALHPGDAAVKIDAGHAPAQHGDCQPDEGNAQDVAHHACRPAAKRLDRGRAGIAGGGDQNSTGFIVGRYRRKTFSKKTCTNILKCRSRAVEQLQRMGPLVQLYQRHDGSPAESAGQTEAASRRLSWRQRTSCLRLGV